jgi:hypothetical protein
LNRSKKKKVGDSEKNGRCKGEIKRGGPCTRNAKPGQVYCHLHDPVLSEARKENASKAGKAARPRNTLKDGDMMVCPTKASEIPEYTARLVDRVITGRLDHRVANSAAYLLGLMVKVIEVSDFEKRLEALEERIQ